MTQIHFQAEWPEEVICCTGCKLANFNTARLCYTGELGSMTDSMGPGNMVRHMQNLSYTYDECLICIRLGPSILSVICKNLLYSGPSYPSSPVYAFVWSTSFKVGSLVAPINHAQGSLRLKPGCLNHGHLTMNIMDDLVSVTVML